MADGTDTSSEELSEDENTSATDNISNGNAVMEAASTSSLDCHSTVLICRAASKRPVSPSIMTSPRPREASQGALGCRADPVPAGQAQAIAAPSSPQSPPDTSAEFCTQLTAMTPSTTTHARYQGFRQAGHSPFGVNLERDPQSCPQLKRTTGLLSKPAYQLCLTVASSAKATNQISAKSQRCQESKSITKSAVCTASIRRRWRRISSSLRSAAFVVLR
mmetsp:Transcript_61890/g.144995  ORF Transcript_61890/g.144995 Transcript_61890/m.144995 type:complete len:219 (-) Transcript_61890:74-730(-)